MLYASRYGTLDAAAGTGIELAAVSAVVVGGVAIFGGSGTVYGAALGALLLGTIRSALVILQVNPFWEQAINGALLLLAIGLDAFLATAIGPRTAQEELAPCLSQVDDVDAVDLSASRAGRRSPSSCCSCSILYGDVDVARTSSPRGNLNSILSDIVGDRAHRAAADAGHHRGGDRPLASPRCSASRAP